MTIAQPEPDQTPDDDAFCFLRMFELKLFCDFKIQCKDGKTFDAHKVILALRSPVFNAMFTSDTKEAKENLMIIGDFNSEIILELLRYVYCRKVENFDEIALDLIRAADKYLLDDLKEFCVKGLVRQLTSDNILKMLTICDKISKTEKLFNSCFDLIIR